MEDRHLFKAMMKDNQEWARGSLVYTFTGTPYVVTEYDHIMNFISINEVDPSTICQCTGLKDKNGNLIWENDIVKISGFISTVNGEYKVFFDTTNHCWALSRNICYHDSYFTFSDLNGFSEDCEVIGNKFDNKDLLEKEFFE